MDRAEQSRLAATFMDIDRRIAESHDVLGSLDDPRRINRYRRDASPEQLREIESRLRGLRDLMHGLM
jgi:hypothetical protein